MRVGIIGAGLAGLTTAWLLGEEHDVVVFEARATAGGHVDSVRVAYPDRDIIVDLGAQYVSWEGFPTHGRLLRALGCTDSFLKPVPVSLSVTAMDGRDVLLVAPHQPDEVRGVRVAVGAASLDVMGRFMEAATAFETSDGDWEMPLESLVEPLPLSRKDKDDLLYPWLSHIVCCSNFEARSVSARAAIAFFVRLAPRRPDEAVTWANAVHGLTDTIDGLVAHLPSDSLRIGAAIRTIDRTGDALVVADEQGHRTEVDRLVLAAPPSEMVPLLAALEGTRDVRLALAAFSYTPAVVAVHLDPCYMPADRRHWSTVCLDIHHGWTEATHWFGPLHDADIFKSWITYRERAPVRLVARRTFRHLVVTPAAVRARAVLAAAQGANGIYFAGSHMTYIDSQESAVLSAIAVARLLAPGSARLASLNDQAGAGAASA